MKQIIFILSCFCVLVFSCKKKNQGILEENAFDRTALLQNVGVNIVQYRFLSLSDAFVDLNNKVSSLSIPVDTNELKQIRESFYSAYTKWQSCSSFEFGPSANVALRSSINTFPTDTALIQSNITNGYYTLGAASNIAAIGFPALDYLLFRNVDLLLTAQYFNDNTLGNKRLTYLKEVSQYGLTIIQVVKQEWHGSYIETFKNANGTDAGSSLSLLINAINLDFESFIRDGKVGIPLGVRSLGNPLPNKAEAFYSKISLDLLEESIVSLQRLINGNGELAGSVGLDDYLNHLGAKHNGELLSNKINNQFSAIITKIHALNQSVDMEVIANNSEVQELYDELQKMIVLLKVDLASSLSILITYQDNDGD